ncbi:HlyD family secretion protein [Diaphorobacter sp. HDW4A]|uniref:HlyD family secretion protein n=1 Tax=Diaphorobacter sp. HDW4A TaxID=2714924 RepID=UPI001409A905|nr:HlyD family secretion protein [Diaphorobacter sp. HDW4A]QIL81250.1 HlyD family secretion protein [Diaphorobacter sp. HDW4A]
MPSNQAAPSNEAENSRVPDASATSQSPTKKGPTRSILLTLLLIAIGAGGWWLYRYQTNGKYVQSTDDAYVQADAVTISPKISGYVEEVLVKDNQDVSPGQPLVRIDARDYRAQVAQASASIDVARANAEAARSQIREQDAAIAQARAQLMSAQAQAEFAASEVRRYAPLVQTGAEPSEQLAAKTNLDKQAASQLAAQRASVSAAERRVSSISAQVKQAEAQAESAHAQRDAAKVNADAANIIASVGGRVGDRTVRVGQFVQAGTRLMSVVPLDKLYITANFKETQIGHMRAGQTVNIRIDALPGLKLQGHVESMAPGTGAQFSLIPPQNATGNFTKIVQRVPVRIALDVDEQVRKVLVPGLSSVVAVNTMADAKAGQ